MLDVPALLLGRLVERAADDAEVVLRRERAAVALGGRAVRHVVEQRLRGRADDRDDVCASGRRGLGLHGVVVDVARRDDDVLQGRRSRGDARAQRVPLLARAVDPPERRLRVRTERVARGVRPRAVGAAVDLRREREALRGVLQSEAAPASSARPRKKEMPRPRSPASRYRSIAVFTSGAQAWSSMPSARRRRAGIVRSTPTDVCESM